MGMIKTAFSVVGFLVAFIFSPLSFSDTTALRFAEIELAKRSHHLQKCREACDRNCRASGASTCSQELCDMGVCKNAKQEWDARKQAHTQAQQALQAAQRRQLINQNQSLAGKNQAIKGGSKSALKHTKEARKNMGLYAVMGVGTTALLTYMAYTCCTSPAAFGYFEPEDKTALKRFYAWLTGTSLELCARPLQWAVPSAYAGTSAATAAAPAATTAAPAATTAATAAAPAASGAGGLPCSKLMCPVYAGGAALAGLQTLKMFRQREKLKKIEESLCEKDAQTGVCSDSESGTQLEQTKWAEVPGCEGDSDRCQKTLCAIDPASSSCSPGGIVFRSAGNTSSVEDGLPERLSTIYAPQGGWPQNQNPYLSKEGYGQVGVGTSRRPVVYNLSPSEQQALDNALMAHNQQQ